MSRLSSLAYMNYRCFSSVQARRVLRHTITSDKLAAMNSKILAKLNKSSETTDLVTAGDGTNLQRSRVTPNQITVQWKFNKDKTGIRKSRFKE